jgi:hypothetical protein
MLKPEPKYNKICIKCERDCKQLESVKLIHCPRFIAKIEQLEIKVPGFGKRWSKK